eukprot:19178-Heterococcus_DN1.PRE.3
MQPDDFSTVINGYSTVLQRLFQRLLQVGDRVGKNEKTKVTCKLQRADAGPPGREPNLFPACRGSADTSCGQPTLLLRSFGVYSEAARGLLAVSEDERKAMMAFYFKRQEELKKLAEANDDDYLASSWADPKQLQKSLRGTGTIQAPGVRRA